MKLTNILENVVATVLSAAAIAFGIWVFSWIRNIILERQLKNAIDPNGVGIEFDPAANIIRFSLQVHNYANAAIRVRSIVFIDDQFHVELRPAREATIHQTPLTNEIIHPTFRRRFLSKVLLEADSNPNAMLLPSKTMGIWEVPSETIGIREWIVNDVYMAFEYATMFGNSALVRMRAPKHSLDLIKSEFEELSKTAFHYQKLHK